MISSFGRGFDSLQLHKLKEVVSKRWHNLIYILSSAIFSFGYATFSGQRKNLRDFIFKHII